MSWLGLVHGDTIVHEQVDSYNPTVFAVLFAVDEKTSMQKATKAGPDLLINIVKSQASWV